MFRVRDELAFKNVFLQVRHQFQYLSYSR